MTENSENVVDEALRKKTIRFLMGMLQESHPHVSYDSDPDYEDGAQYFTDKNAGHRKVLTILYSEQLQVFQYIDQFD